MNNKLTWKPQSAEEQNIGKHKRAADKSLGGLVNPAFSFLSRPERHGLH